MSNPYELFSTNKELEAGAGVALDYPGFTIFINRAGGANKKFAKALDTRMKPHRQRFERGMLDEETSLKLLVEAYAEGVVVGWEDVKDKNGKNMEFNFDNCVKLLTDLPDLFADIQEQASNVSLFREMEEAVAEKN
jgi:hypothetical protein